MSPISVMWTRARASARSHLPHRTEQAPREAWQTSLMAIVVAEMLAMLGFGVTMPFLPYYVQDLGVKDLREVALWVGLLNAGGQTALALTAPIWGILSDRFGRKPMLVRAMVGGSLILGLMGIVTTPGQLTVLRIIQGTLTGTIGAANTLVASLVPRDRAGYALGLLQAGVFVGSWLGPAVGGLVGGTLGYRMACYVSAVLLFAGGLLVLFLVHENYRPVVRVKGEGNGLRLAISTIIHDPVLRTIMGTMMILTMASNVSIPVLPLFIQTMVADLRSATTSSGVIMGVAAMTNALSAIVLGRFADSWGRRRVLVAAMTFSALTYFPMALAMQTWHLLALRGLMGLATGVLSPIANAVIAERCPEGRQGGIYGISSSLNSISMAVGPLAGTAIVRYWVLPAVFPVSGVLLLLGVALVIFALPSLSRQAERAPA